MIIDRNWAKSSGGGDNTKLKEIIEGNITEITAEDLEGVEKIGDSSFREKKTLEKVSLPTTVKDIETYSFYYCSALSELDLNEGLENIGSNAFAYTALKNIHIPSTVKTLGPSAFERIQNNRIESFTFAENSQLETIGSSVLSGAYVVSEGFRLDLPDTVKSIGKYAFRVNSGNIDYVRMPNSIESVAAETVPASYKSKMNQYGNGYYFDNETNPYIVYFDKVDATASSITIHKDCKVIAGHEQRTNTTLTDIIFEEGSALETIGYESFYKHTALANIIFPETLKRIEQSAFKGCTGLTEVIIPNGVTTIDQQAFSGCTGLTRIVLPENLTKVTNAMCGTLSNLTELVFNCRNCEDAGTDVNARTQWLRNIGTNTDGVHVIFTDSVEHIPAYSFYNGLSDLSKINKVTIGNNVKTIGDYAFGALNITEIELPSTIERIGNWALYSSALATITINATTPPIIQANTLHSNTTTIRIPAGTLEAYSTATNWARYADKFVELPAE